MVFRKTEEKDCPQVIALYQQAQSYFKEAGIDQWQNGYPNAETLAEDMAGGESYVLVDKETGEVLGTCFVSFEKEPDYDWEKILSGSNNYDEAARFLYHCAVSLSTSFGNFSSRSYLHVVLEALVNTFSYVPDSLIYYDGNYDTSIESLTKIILKELKCYLIKQ